MEKQQTLRRKVKQLSPEVARKIAAGEVIDRPNAIVRELLDNAVDSGADFITVELSGGGIEKIRVSDNGCGMTKEDLSACARPHATSKIVEAQDLLNLSTLGFRGEALASIAAVSRLSVSSGNWKMRASIGEDHVLEEIPPVQNGKGTVVMSEGLFENYPARRMFLKREASETLLCRETFVEKSLPRTDIAFRLFIDGELRLDLPKDVSLAERFCRANELKEPPELFSELKEENDDFSFRLVIGEPGIYKTHRKQIMIYVNGRRVNEYSLMQAVEYGCQGFFPNGTHPVAALFVEINPALVDFNIHPAKKEVRFKDSSYLHHRVSQTVQAHFRAYGIKNSGDFEKRDADKNQAMKNDVPGFDFSYNTPTKKDFALNDSSFQKNIPIKKENASYSLSHNSSFRSERKSPLSSQFLNYERTENIKLSDMVNSALEEPPAPLFSIPDTDGFCFIGSVLNCFLVCETGETVYFIDQHAAHERILFDRIFQRDAECQSLLIPYKIETQNQEEEKFMEQSLGDLEKAGFKGEKKKNGIFEFSTIPVLWKGSEGDFQEAVLEKTENPQKLIYSVAAMTACKAAVKDGDILDRGAAEKLARQALALPDPHCPHGRPVWTTLTKEQLFMRVRRTR